jgi:hypothetical protein
MVKSKKAEQKLPAAVIATAMAALTLVAWAWFARKRHSA